MDGYLINDRIRIFIKYIKANLRHKINVKLFRGDKWRTRIVFKYSC